MAATHTTSRRHKLPRQSCMGALSHLNVTLFNQVKRRARARLPDVRSGDGFGVPSDASIADLDVVREARIDRIEAGKNRLWRFDLRISQLAHGVLMAVSISFVAWWGWAMWAGAVAAAVAVAGMWTIARRMVPHEERLRRHLAALARRRRTCLQCGYRLRGLTSDRCPECGLRFDPDDERFMFGPQALRTFSQRARQTSVVIIVFVIFWVCAMANGDIRTAHAALAFGLLAAIHALHTLWNREARRSEPPAVRPNCTGCGAELPPSKTGMPRNCPSCERPLIYADVFVRPDSRRLADPRVIHIQHQALLLRWIFICAICGGATALVQLDPVVRRLIAFAPAGPLALVVLAVPVLLYVVPISLVFQRLARGQQRKFKTLFAQIFPTCPRCATDISSQRVGDPCANCGRAIRLTHVTG